MPAMTKLERLLIEHSLPCGALLATDGEVLERAGDFSGMDWARSLLGSQAFLIADGPIRPAMSGHGREFALLERVEDGLLIVFGMDRAEGMEHILFARRVGESIEREFQAAT